MVVKFSNFVVDSGISLKKHCVEARQNLYQFVIRRPFDETVRKGGCDQFPCYQSASEHSLRPDILPPSSADQSYV